MRCLVSSCNHDSSTSYVQGITFYLLPTQAPLRGQWLKALGREGWKFNEVGVVCSDHFLSKDYYMTKGGQRRLRADAMPFLQKIPNSAHSTITCDVEVCRICFATDCKLYSMVKHKNLNKAYESLAGLMTDNEDKLPSYLCVVCAHRLLSCARFRTNSLRAHVHLLELLNKHERLTPEIIKSVKRNQIFRPNFSAIHKTDHYDLDIVHVKKEYEHNVEVDAVAAPTVERKTRNGNMIELEIIKVDRPKSPRIDRVPNLHEEVLLDDIKMEDDMYDKAMSDDDGIINAEVKRELDEDECCRGKNAEMASVHNHLNKNPAIIYIKAETSTQVVNENRCVGETSDEDVTLANLRGCNVVEAENSASMLRDTNPADGSVVSEMPSKNAVKCKNYRKRKKDAALKIKITKTPAERSRVYRLRKKQLAQGSKSFANELLYTASTLRSQMTFEPSPHPVTADK